MFEEMNERQQYTIRLQGRLDPRWTGWFDGMSITYAEPLGETVLSGGVPDQAALHGLLAKIRDLNLELISVEKQTRSEWQS